MLKKLFFLTLAFSLAFALSERTFASEDFSQMNPTVKVTSYKRLFTDRIYPVGSGSATIITPNGYAITNNHVIFDENEQVPLDTFEVCITFDVSEEPVCKYTAQLVANNKDMDVALIKINEKDVLSQPLPPLRYLSYQENVEPREKTQVQVLGYPGSGGETITISKGQISGYDVFNGFKYFKTDTDFDHGSSGGTVLDENGKYIGIPTYIRSIAENVGYFLDLREAQSWITENLKKIGTGNEKAENRLVMELSRLIKANNDKKFTYTEYPNLSLTIPNGWKLYQIEDDGLYLEQEKITDGVGLGIYINYYQYKIDGGYLAELDKELAKIRKDYPDFEQTDIEFNGLKATQVSYTYYDQRQYAIHIPYGYTLVGLNYSISLDQEEKQTKAIQEVLDSIKLGAKEQDEPSENKTIHFEEPGFSLTMPEGWSIQKNRNASPVDLLADAVQKDNFEGFININYAYTPKDQKILSAKERADEDSKYLGGNSKIISKNADISLDGLKGYLITYEYEGDDYQQTRKRMTVTLLNGDYDLGIVYDDLADTFDANLDDIESILKSFNFDGDTETAGVYDYGNLNQRFSDIQHHRFASDISELADKEIVKGYEDGSFRPEALISRAEALKIILTSKNVLETDKKLGKEVNFDDYNEINSPYTDVKKDDWFKKYVTYASDKGMVEGVNNRFMPTKTVNLAEALKMIMTVYEISVWDGVTTPWYKKYLDKAYELYILPDGIEDPARNLTRAELTYLVNQVYKQAK